MTISELETVNKTALPTFDKFFIDFIESFWEGEDPDGDPMPHAVIDSHDDKRTIMAIDHGMMQNKDYVASIVIGLGGIVREVGRDVGFSYSAWSLNHEDLTEEEKDWLESEKNTPRPESLQDFSTHPGRREIVFCICQDKDSFRFYQATITRSEDSPVLSPWQKMPDEAESSGRFQEEFQRAFETVQKALAGAKLFGKTIEEVRESFYRLLPLGDK